jgi:hypothetical protein
MVTPVRSPNTSLKTSRYKDSDSAELVSKQAAIPASGSIRR